MDTCPTVELGVLGAHLKKGEKRERLKTERDDKLFKKVKGLDLGV